MTFELSQAVRPNILRLKPYRCARDDYSKGILLDANENTHGPSLAAAEKNQIICGRNGQLERYPDPHQMELKKCLCSFRNIPSEAHFYLGVGSDECIDMAMRVFVRPGIEKVLITPPTYGMYSVCATINDVGLVKVPLLENFQLDLPKIINTVKKDPLIKIIILCSPGNPTGTLLNHNDIKSLLSIPEYKGVVMVDEAYIDFCDPVHGRNASVAEWVLEYPNLIVSQTLSKAFGLAGIRLGLTISSPEIAGIFNATKAPYNISTPTSLLGISSLSESGLKIMQIHVNMIKKERNYLQEEILKLSFISEILGSQNANFVLARVVDDQGNPNNDRAHYIYKTLAETEGVVIRFRGTELHCEGCLRITIGTQSENQILLQKLKTFETRLWT